MVNEMPYKKVHRLLDAELLDADIAVAAAIAKSKISTGGTWATADIPSLPATKIGSGTMAELVANLTGFLTNVRGGLEKEVVGDFQNDYIVVYKTADGKFHMQSLGAPAAHNFLDAATHNNTLAGTPVRGDLIVANSTPAWARFPKGAQYYSLIMGANDPAWSLIVNANIDAAAAIAESKLALSYATHARSHALSSGSDHTGAITTTQHGALAAITNAHAHSDLSGLTADGHERYFDKDGTKVMTGALRLALLTADPTLVDGMLLYRQDLDSLYFAYDPGTGVIKKQVMLEGLSQAEGVLFGNGFSDTLQPSGLTKTGNGVLTATALYGILTSGAALNDKTAAYCIWSPTSPAMGDAVYGKYPQFELYIYIPDATNLKIWVLWGGSNNVAETAINKRFGIKIVGTALWGLAADGATLTETDLATTLAQGTWYKLRVKHTGSNITVWKDGVEIATKVTTNLPSGSDTAEACVQVICANTVAVDKSVRFKPLKMMHGS
jgi:hypothetical protein